MENNRKKYDVGSHTEFFYLEAMEGLVWVD
jgi:hypothetical protein